MRAHTHTNTHTQTHSHSPAATHAQAALEAERLTLKARLKDALRLHMTPCTRLDTTSPIDRTVAILDNLLEVGMLFSSKARHCHSTGKW